MWRALYLLTQGPWVGSRGKNSISWVGSRLPRQESLKGRDTNRISTRFFLCVQNMSRCVKNQKPGQSVGVSFCHSCHSVKKRQKHLGLLESSRGPPHHVQTHTCLVSDHTYRWGPAEINDFSNLTDRCC